jgi:hypothetical protein
MLYQDALTSSGALTVNNLTADEEFVVESNDEVTILSASLDVAEFLPSKTYTLVL